MPSLLSLEKLFFFFAVSKCQLTQKPTTGHYAKNKRLMEFPSLNG